MASATNSYPPYHPQANGVVERGNRVLGDALRALLLERSQEDWDLVLPQLLRAFLGTSQSGTGETANLLMLGRELRLPDLLMNSPPPETTKPNLSTPKTISTGW